MTNAKLQWWIKYNAYGLAMKLKKIIKKKLFIHGAI